MTIGLQIKTDGLEDFIGDASKEIPRHIHKGMLDAAQATTGYIRSEIMETFGNKGNRTTGQLARSFAPRFVKTEKDEITAGSFSDLVYAGIQNRGGPIVPKVKQALTVPIGMGKTLAVGTRARDVPGLVMIKRGGGKPPLLVKPGKKKFTLYYVLVKKVVLPATHYIEKAAEKSEPEVDEILTNMVQAGIDKADK